MYAYNLFVYIIKGQYHSEENIYSFSLEQVFCFLVCLLFFFFFNSQMSIEFYPVILLYLLELLYCFYYLFQ